MEIKGADKPAFRDSLVSTSGLFGLVVDSFAERFTAAQKCSQAMRHFLPRRSSSTKVCQLGTPQNQRLRSPQKTTLTAQYSSHRTATRLTLYCFPPVALLPQVREDRRTEPLGQNQPRLLELASSPEEDHLSQAKGMIWHP